MAIRYITTGEEEENEQVCHKECYPDRNTIMCEECQCTYKCLLDDQGEECEMCEVILKILKQIKIVIINSKFYKSYLQIPILVNNEES